jgi:hypothetical protein
MISSTMLLGESLDKGCSNRLARVTIVTVENTVAQAHSRFRGGSCGVEEEVAEACSILGESVLAQRRRSEERRVSKMKMNSKKMAELTR